MRVLCVLDHKTGYKKWEANNFTSHFYKYRLSSVV